MQYVFLVPSGQKRVEFRTSKIEYKMDLFAKIVQRCTLSTIFIQNSVSDVPLSLNTTLQIASHYQLSQKAKQLIYSLIKLLLIPSQNR